MQDIDQNALSQWIAQNTSDFQEPYRFELIAGGRSNLTYRVFDRNGSSIVLRRPPTAHVLPTAHDMTREFTIISALAPTIVPVAEPIALCQDQSVSELPFYLMSYVDGFILKEIDEVNAHFSLEDQKVIANSLISVLANLHSLDPDEIGLGNLAKKSEYIQRQLHRWHSQYLRSSEEINQFDPIINEVFHTLEEAVPPQRRTSVVHGDYRLDNVMISKSATVAAVLDWEICTLGDPLADLGLLMVYWTNPSDIHSALGRATTAEGFPPREELATQYASIAGVDISDLPYYISFAYWKLACILKGVYSRYTQGATGGDQSDVSGYGDQVRWLGEQAASALQDHLGR